jgi:GMP synthase (glutamine-hydrolysing)
VRDEAEHKADNEVVEVGARRCRDAEGVNILAVIHGTSARGGVFEEVVRAAGHGYEEWSPAWAATPSRSFEEYGAVLVFGGSMHADQDDQHPWLREENTLIQDLLERQVPMLGICLGIQLLAKAEGAAVYPLAGGPEVGWFPVELTDAAAEDPLFCRLPVRFEAFGWHYYTYDLPERAEELARSTRCNQAFRLGETAWGVQCHPEVTHDTVRAWLADKDDSSLGLDREALAVETAGKIGAWNDFGRALCGGFVEIAERAAVAV